LEDFTQKVFNSDNFSSLSFEQELCIAQVTFAEKPQIKINSSQKQKHEVLIHSQ